MKELVEFIMWQWGKWQGWQRIYFISMIVIVLGLVTPGLIGAILIVLGLTSLLSWLFKWAVWDSISDAYNEFKKEKQDEQN
jgi:hypothetical protein